MSEQAPAGSRKALEQRLFSEISKRFQVSADSLEASADIFETLKIDSYKAMELITELEDAFAIEIPDYELQGVTTFGGLAEVIGRRV